MLGTRLPMIAVVGVVDVVVFAISFGKVGDNGFVAELRRDF